MHVALSVAVLIEFFARKPVVGGKIGVFTDLYSSLTLTEIVPQLSPPFRKLRAFPSLEEILSRMNPLLPFKRPLILASASPRRRLLLQQLNLDFEVRTANIDEERIASGLAPRDYVQTLAQRKAIAVAAEHDTAIVIGADTIVVLDGAILNKPANPTDAKAMLRTLSDRTHEVYTGFAIVQQPGGELLTDVQTTAVRFRHLDDDEIAAYVASGSPLDKAGSYGIQDDFGAVFVQEIRGCYYNVVGLPLELLYRRLRELCEQGEGSAAK